MVLVWWRTTGDGLSLVSSCSWFEMSKLGEINEEVNVHVFYCLCLMNVSSPASCLRSDWTRTTRSASVVHLDLLVLVQRVHVQTFTLYDPVHLRSELPEVLRLSEEPQTLQGPDEAQLR